MYIQSNIMEIFIDTLHWYLLCAGTIKQLALACAGRDGQYTIIIFAFQIQKGQTTLPYYWFVFSHLILIAWISLSNYLNLTDGLINHCKQSLNFFQKCHLSPFHSHSEQI